MCPKLLRVLCWVRTTAQTLQDTLGYKVMRHGCRGRFHTLPLRHARFKAGLLHETEQLIHGHALAIIRDLRGRGSKVHVHCHHTVVTLETLHQRRDATRSPHPVNKQRDVTAAARCLFNSKRWRVVGQES